MSNVKYTGLFLENNNNLNEILSNLIGFSLEPLGKSLKYLSSDDLVNFRKLFKSIGEHYKKENNVNNHMTISLGNLKDTFKKNKHFEFSSIFINNNLQFGDKKIIKIIGIGIDEKSGVIAFKVKSEVPSKNETKHITAYLKDGAKAFHSNKINNWFSFKNEIEIESIFGEFLIEKENGSYLKINSDINKYKTLIKPEEKELNLVS